MNPYLVNVCVVIIVVTMVVVVAAYYYCLICTPRIFSDLNQKFVM